MKEDSFFFDYVETKRGGVSGSGLNYSLDDSKRIKNHILSVSRQKKRIKKGKEGETIPPVCLLASGFGLKWLIELMERF